MFPSTRDFVMPNIDERKVLKSRNAWYQNDNRPQDVRLHDDYNSFRNETLPPSPVSSQRDEGCSFRGKTWADRVDDELHEKGQKRHASSRSPNSGSEKENTNKCMIKPLETDKRKLQTRQRQIDIGKETAGYKRYMREIRRKDRTLDHPRTPNKYTVCSTRSWQGTVRVWRRKLHYWDTAEAAKNAQEKFANILTSNYMFEEDNSNDEEEMSKSRKIDNSIDNEDCVSEESSQNSSEGNDSNLIMDDPMQENMLFWSGI